MERFVAMPSLPPGITFPQHLRDRVRHDPAQGRLYFQGFMSKADFDRLCRLSDDWSYRRPLEELFRQCVEEDAPTPLFRRLASALHLFGL